jgi:aminopeptidase N
MQKAYGQPLEQFFKQWLYTPGHLQLSIKWKYDAAEKAVSIEIGQIQTEPYESTVEFLIGNEIHEVEVKNKFTTVQIPVTGVPSSVIVDPNMNLLATFEISEGK